MGQRETREGIRQLFLWWILANNGSQTLFWQWEEGNSYIEMQHSHCNEHLNMFFLQNRVFKEHWSQVHLIVLGTQSLLFICVSFWQKWNTQISIPASSRNKINFEEDREKKCIDLHSTNESFPVEQLQTFSQLLQNIHRLEVSFRNVLVSSLNVFWEDKGHSSVPCWYVDSVWAYLVLTEHLVLPEGDKWVLEMVLLPVKGLDNSDRFSGNLPM